MVTGTGVQAILQVERGVTSNALLCLVVPPKKFHVRTEGRRMCVVGVEEIAALSSLIAKRAVGVCAHLHAAGLPNANALIPGPVTMMTTQWQRSGSVIRREKSQVTI